MQVGIDINWAKEVLSLNPFVGKVDCPRNTGDRHWRCLSFMQNESPLFELRVYVPCTPEPNEARVIAYKDCLLPACYFAYLNKWTYLTGDPSYKRYRQGLAHIDFACDPLVDSIHECRRRVAEKFVLDPRFPEAGLIAEALAYEQT